MLLHEQDALHDYEEDATTWIALSDLMTGLMAIFLALSIAILVMQKSERDTIILSVTEELTNSLKEQGIEANVDPKTGRLIVSTETNFDLGSATLKPEGKQDLNIIIPTYANAIFGNLTDEQQQRIDRIIVEGHTDRVGGYSDNMILSSQRANAILRYVDEEMGQFDYKKALLTKLTAVGRGENDATGYDEVPNPTDRNVVFRFEFKEGAVEQADTSTPNTQKIVTQLDDMTS